MDTTDLFLYETSWEVCNKVSGLYNVLRSKLHEAGKNFGNRYSVIGPLFEVNPDFTEETGADAAQIRDLLKAAGISALVGKWNHPAAPRTILVKYRDVLDQDKALYQLWEDYGVDSMSGGPDYIEPVLFSIVAGRAVEALAGTLSGRQAVAHFHEWYAGAGLLYLKKNAPDVATVFTTHATVLGQAISATGRSIPEMLENLNTDSEAARLNVFAKHSLESACAREADCFTTISDTAALESQHILHAMPERILPNGFNVKQAPDFNIQPEYFHQCRDHLLRFASLFLKRPLEPEQTLILSTSGRYEFKNKGLDLLLESLGDLNRDPVPLQRQTVMFLFLMADAVRASDDQGRFERYAMLSTHSLWDSQSDPIINACLKHNLLNRPEDKVNIIFVPAYLNGTDGVLNIPYYDALAGCDATLFPFFYEPWGHTAAESLAYSVPTCISDLSGFGKWIRSKHLDGKGLRILEREKKDLPQQKAALNRFITELSQSSPAALSKVRSELRSKAMNTEWEIFYSHYLQAYDSAGRDCKSRQEGRSRKAVPEKEARELRGTDSPRPRLHKLSVKASIPDRLSRLRELAYNLWWSWKPEAREIFSLLDPLAFEKFGHNPVLLLESLGPKKFKDMAANDTYKQLYDNVVDTFNKYVRFTENRDRSAPLAPERPVAYFSMEYGIHECLPIYSGGLGILSGDHIKSASDINLPLVGMGLLYKTGYFRQVISKEGEQKVHYLRNNFFNLPITEVRSGNERLIIAVDLPGRKLYARAWEARVGRVPVYFMDTDIPDNNPTDRTITGQLYGGDKRLRIEQEILLGVGGVRLLSVLGIQPSVYHLNEGHSGFLILERLVNLIQEEGLELKIAQEVIRAGTIFTTHTPVPAGNETFEMNLIENYFRSYMESRGMSWEDFNELGHRNLSDHGPYEMTVLALKNTQLRNGVSKLHGVVARHMWADLWKGLLKEEMPITHVTNGVHAESWIAPELQQLIRKYCAVNLNEDLLKREVWQKIFDIPDDILWQTHQSTKRRLMREVKERVSANWNREGEDPSLVEKLSEKLSSSPLTIGFARRFTAYKRPNLIARDMDRLRRILLNKRHPVQFIFAGKAHPADTVAYSFIREIVALSKQPDFLGKILFVENYDISLAKLLVSGADVWLNNPRRPLEASGTSGQKAGMNGVINFSIPDGWWDEAWNGENGWSFGERTTYTNTHQQDAEDSEALYDVLENEIIPEFYRRSSAGVPEAWVRRMKSSMSTIIEEYNTHRMLSDYRDQLYRPAAERHARYCENNYRLAREAAAWKQSITARFSSLHIEKVMLEGIKGDVLNVGDEMKVTLKINPGKVRPRELAAELVVIRTSREEIVDYTGNVDMLDEDIQIIPMQVLAGGGSPVTFSASYEAQTSGKVNYGIRVKPSHPEIKDAADLNLVYWA